MGSRSNETRTPSQYSPNDFGTTRRAVLAAGGAVALSGLAGCAALDDLVDRGSDQLVGTRVSSPAAFYAGQAPPDPDTDGDGLSDGDDLVFFGSSEGNVRKVPATVRADSREIELEGWSINTTTKAQGYNSSKEPRLKHGMVPYAWWAGPDDDGDDDDVDEDAIIEYLAAKPTIGERFTICLPDANLRGDRGSLAAELTPGRVLAYFAPSREPDGVRAPFNDQYGGQGLSYDDDGCVQIDGPISLHEDLACQNILSAELDTYRTANRAMVGYSTDGGAVVSGALESADTDGKCVFVAADGTLREPGSSEIYDATNDTWTQLESPTLVCPVAVTPEDCPCPLPGLFYVRRVIHDDQVIFAGGWMLDEGALFEDAVTLLFDEGSTEVASVTPQDLENDDYDHRIVEQFSRGRSHHGSAVISGDLDAIVESGGVPKAQLTAKLDILLGTGDDEGPSNGSLTALDAPLVHLDGARELSDEEKLKLARGIDKKDIRRGM